MRSTSSAMRLTYGISLAVIGARRDRANAALIQGRQPVCDGAMGRRLDRWHVFVRGVPEAEVMGIVGFLALAANVTSVMLLMRYKDGDANVRSVWLCSRNDAIGNVAVMIAALGVWGTATGWPDLIVAAIMASLFLSSSWQIISAGSGRAETRGSGSDDLVFIEQWIGIELSCKAFDRRLRIGFLGNGRDVVEAIALIDDRKHCAPDDQPTLLR
jgi:hypothetical protein